MTSDNSITVRVTKRASRPNFFMWHRDPTTEKQVVRTTGESTMRAALRKAAVWEDELRSGISQSDGAKTWDSFREEYEHLHLSSLSPNSRPTYYAAMGHLERIMAPKRLSSITSRELDRFAANLRDEGMRETTIRCTVRHIGAILSWAFRRNYIKVLPKMPEVRRAKGRRMRGRPINLEEFERILAATDKVRPNDAAKWKRLLRGLWLSGLRISDATKLSWEYSAPFALISSGKHPAFHISADAQKASRDEIVPCTPDFAQWIMETPEEYRSGFVFNMLGGLDKNISPKHAWKVISAIGKRTGILVNPHEKKFASAHDLRRSFGTRWASRVKPVVLQKLMRHANIQTTLNFYVSLDSDDVASQLWANYSQDAEVNETSDETSPILATSRAYANKAL